jgi:hypothetical protein
MRTGSLQNSLSEVGSNAGAAEAWKSDYLVGGSE